MAKLDIKIYPDKILRKKSKPVIDINSEIKTLAHSMIETMRASNGIGLAAPQVGVAKRIIVIDAIEDMRSPVALINPKILKRKGRSKFCEGCLSIPEITSDIIRPEAVSVEGLALNGNPLKIDAAGLLARVIQHEMDHLEGVLFIDRIGFFKRKRLIKELDSKICMRL